ncbi:16S rRNA (guanine(527)-N(7))-methyltransferase RsmG [Egicoccus sp. AB-alg6-2]|uniref:16S rRNA (guanine(527)-N(7))-methyltransferase RsmG n=1 Tax=Egicoccus sp. AB-alg6-2 TaxID=3242692 RepID=UPI00359CC3A7
MVDSTPAMQATALEAFVAAVEASPHNLVSRQARQELRARHLAESMAFARGLPSGPARVLDLGSGGGFPGVVVAIVRQDLRVALLDSTTKKVEFLRGVVAELELDVEVHHGRAEDLGGGALRATFDLVTARAVAPLERLVPWAFPFLRAGGQLHAIKGERWAQELREAEPVLRRLGGRVLATPAENDGAGIGPSPRVVTLVRS